MQKKTKKNDANIPGQISLTLVIEDLSAENVFQNKGVKKSEYKKKPNRVPRQAKDVSPETYCKAKALLEGYCKINEGILINHLRISANEALTIIHKMYKESLLTEDGKPINKKGKVYSNWHDSSPEDSQ